MKHNAWKLTVLLGVLMICAAGGLCVYNVRESRQAAAFSDQVVQSLKQDIPAPAEAPVQEPDTEPAQEDLFAPYAEAEPAQSEPPQDIRIGNDAYCGYLELPALGLELPVMSGWSYPALKRAPCRYSGTAQDNDLIIAAHNYSAHFGRIGDLETGDSIIFTDTSGQVYNYTVAFAEVIAGTDVDQMFSGQATDWDLTLFTCTLSGQSRVTIRAYRQTDEPAQSDDAEEHEAA